MHIARKFSRTLAGLVLFLPAAVATAEVVVIVSAKNPTASLTADQASDIFLSNSGSFPGGGQAVPVDQAEGSALRDEFYTRTSGKSPAQVKAFWSKMIFTGKGRPPKEVGDSLAVKKLVADNPNLIGYIDRNAVDASVKVVLTVR